MSRIPSEASELSFEAGGCRVNSACSQNRLECLRQQADRLAVTRPNLKVVLDRVCDGNESALVVSVRHADGPVDPADLPQSGLVDIRHLILMHPHAP